MVTDTVVDYCVLCALRMRVRGSACHLLHQPRTIHEESRGVARAERGLRAHTGTLQICNEWPRLRSHMDAPGSGRYEIMYA